MPRSEPMTAVDTAWLRMDRPDNLMMITGILMLEGPVDSERVERVLSSRLAALPRFHRRVEETLRGHAWVDDARFDIANHVKRVRLPGAGGQKELEAFVSDLASQPLDPQRPLWQMHLVEDYQGGAALVAKIHHAIGDGIALAGTLLSLTDPEPDGDLGPDRPPAWTPAASPGSEASLFPEALSWGLRLSASMAKSWLGASTMLWRTWFDLLANPGKALDYLGKGSGVTAELAHLLLMSEDSRTRFKGALSGRKKIAWTAPLPLRDVKAVSHARNCTVNDLLLATVAGGLRAYLQGKGDPVDGLELRAVIPVNLRPPAEWRDLGNRFGLVAVELPIGIADSGRRLQAVHERMAAIKKSFEPPVTFALFSILGSAPKALQDSLADIMLGRMSAVVTNVPGPEQPVYLGGSRLRQAIVWVPQSGKIGLGISILSFDGHVQFGLSADAALVPDPETVIGHIRAAFEDCLHQALRDMKELSEAAEASRRRK